MKIMGHSERGQAIVVLALVIVVLLGFTALAVDGGMVYSDRRNAQNAADAAALAGALEKVNFKDNTQVLDTVKVSLESNGYDAANSSSKVTGLHTDWTGRYYLVHVTLTDTTKTYFAQMVYSDEIKNVVTAVAKARPSQPAAVGMAIMAMANCQDDVPNLLAFEGGGGDASIRSFDGGIFVNSPESPSDYCAFDLPTSTGSEGVVAETGFSISSIGSYDYSGKDKMSPLPVEANINGGIPIPDPLEFLPEPQCTGDGFEDPDTGNYTPGSYNSMPNGILDPGIFCIKGDIKIEVEAPSGVLIYLEDGGIKVTGNENFKINGPTTGNCLGTKGDPTASCTYAGMSIFVARDNTNEIELGGNGEYEIDGTVYHINGTVNAGGGGNSPGDYTIRGQVIASRVYSNGHGDFTVTYDAGSVVWAPGQISLVK